MRRITIYLVLLVFSVNLQAQDSTSEGLRILVKTRTYVTDRPHNKEHPVRLTGHLVEITKDSLFMVADNRLYPVSISLNTIKKIKISRGKQSRLWAYLGTGMALGALSMGLHYSGMEVDDLDPKDPYLIGAGYGALAGIVFGLLDGKRERWKKVYLTSLQPKGVE